MPWGAKNPVQRLVHRAPGWLAAAPARPASHAPPACPPGPGTPRCRRPAGESVGCPATPGSCCSRHTCARPCRCWANHRPRGTRARHRAAARQSRSHPPGACPAARHSRQSAVRRVDRPRAVAVVLAAVPVVDWGPAQVQAPGAQALANPNRLRRRPPAPWRRPTPAWPGAAGPQGAPTWPPVRVACVCSASRLPVVSAPRNRPPHRHHLRLKKAVCAGKVQKSGGRACILPPTSKH